MTGLTIGRLAKATGTKVETIRYYERIGLLAAPLRSDGNYRAYDQEALSRLGFIRRARQLGFSIEQVRELLDLSDDRSRSCGAVDEIARQHLLTVEQKIADLTLMGSELGAMIRSCETGKVAECRIIEALGGQSRSELSPRACPAPARGI